MASPRSPQQPNSGQTASARAQEIANQTVQSIDKRLETLGKLYGTHGYSGLVSVVGTAILLFILVVSATTVPGLQTSGLLNFDTQEEVIFVIAGLLLILLGGFSFGFRNYLQYRMEALNVEIKVKQIEAIRDVTSSGVQAIQQEPPGPRDLPRG
jgi:hypothetical protein